MSRKRKKITQGVQECYCTLFLKHRIMNMRENSQYGYINIAIKAKLYQTVTVKAQERNNTHLRLILGSYDCLCGLVIRVLGYRSRGPGSIPGTTRFFEK
jgi:hypothetical protein